MSEPSVKVEASELTEQVDDKSETKQQITTEHGKLDNHAQLPCDHDDNDAKRPATEPVDDDQKNKRPRKSPPSSSGATAAANKTGKSTKAAAKTTNASHDSDDTTWALMFFKLVLFHSNRGDFNVPGKTLEHKKLFDWVQKQRQEFKLYQAKDPNCKLTTDQVLVLKDVQFPLTTRGDDHWKRNYENLTKFKQDHGHVLVPRQSETQGLGDWVTDQRRQLKALKQGKPSLLTPQRKQLLDDLGFVWEVRSRPEWADRYQELLEYKEKYGNTCVPQFFTENRGLGKWVAKQREQYKLKRQGKHSFLTADREELLVNAGFVWSVKGQVVEDYDDDDDMNHVAMEYPPAMVAAADTVYVENQPTTTSTATEHQSTHQPNEKVGPSREQQVLL